ncbi:MAG: chemotaxis protein CheA [Sulfuricurvum sp.]
MGIKSKLNAVFDYEIVDEFLDHYTIMSDCIDALIIDLGKEELFERSLDELKRVIHNIASSTSYLKLESINRLANFVEGVLDEIRSKNSKINHQTEEWLLLVADTLKLWGDELENDEDLSPIKFSLLKLPDLEAK